MSLIAFLMCLIKCFRVIHHLFFTYLWRCLIKYFWMLGVVKRVRDKPWISKCTKFLTTFIHFNSMNSRIPNCLPVVCVLVIMVYYSISIDPKLMQTKPFTYSGRRTEYGSLRLKWCGKSALNFSFLLYFLTVSYSFC